MTYYPFRLKVAYGKLKANDIVYVLFGRFGKVDDVVPRDQLNLRPDSSVFIESWFGRGSICSNAIEYLEMKKGDKFILTYLSDHGFYEKLFPYKGKEIVLEKDLVYGSREAFFENKVRVSANQVSVISQRCVCEIQDLMLRGCRCGGN